MGASILTAERDVTAGRRHVTAHRVGAAWSAIGPRGRCLALGAGAGVVGVGGWWTTATPLAIAVVVSALLLLLAAVVDAVEHRLPNVLVGAAAAPVVVAAVVSFVATSVPAAGAAGGALLVAVPLLLAHLVSPSGMGFGDVKAGAVLGGALGLIDVQIALLALFVGLAGAAIWGVARRERAVALGPGLVGGAVVALISARIAGVEANPWR